MQDAIRIHSRDNVAVALRDLPANTQVEINQQTISLQQEVGRGHKFALQPLATDALVIKYGLPIAHATQPIAAGEIIHSSNARTNLSDVDEYDYQPDFLELPPQAGDR
ncbi:UxaA family hydrolase, partial [Pantoea sp. CTOTU49201]|uniref:UxaA family hydrolase n=1 Tax=Pantoea sp. CTOTU49201 TaxID=2953855 RepID=UPI00289C9E52